MAWRSRCALLALALAAAPWIIPAGYYLHLVDIGLVFALLAVSLNIVLGYAGQIALGHAGLFGIGAYTAAITTAGRSGVFFWPGFLAAGAAAGAAGLAIGIPILRLRGQYFALATIGFGEIMQDIFFNWQDVTGGMDGISGIPAPSLGFVSIDGDIGFFYLVAAILAVVMILTKRLEISKYGRMFKAIRDAELAAGTCRVHVPRMKILAFTLSAVTAGFAGSLYAHLMSYISPDVFVFEVTASVLSMVLVGGIGTVWGPLLGAVLLTFLPEALRVSKEYYLLFYGAGIAAMVIFLPNGIMGLVKSRLFSRIAGRQDAAATVAADADAAEPSRERRVEGGVARRPAVAAEGPLLKVEGLSMSFGGVRAIDRLHLAVAPGTIHALIGPNGSGKSTFINLATGIYRTGDGDILFEGRSIRNWRPWDIARLGIARTFQNLRLFPTMTVEENVLVGCAAAGGGGLADVFLADARARREERALRARAADALAFMGLWELRDRLVRTLPHERQRLVEIARAIAAEPRLVMLDEPAAGMNSSEAAGLIERIRRLRQSGLTIFIIEHNVPLVMQLADRVTVMNFGQMIAEGTPAEMQRSPGDRGLSRPSVCGKGMRMALLEVSDLHAGYGDGIEVLHGLEFAVGDGEFVTLIGANGAGKSTTLRSLTNLVRPSRGQVRFIGQDVTHMDTSAIARMGIAMVPEGRGVFPGLTVYDNLRIAATPWARRGAAIATSSNSSTRFFRCCVSGGISSVGRFQADSSRCWRSAGR